jgi:hypothetical protein
MGPCTVCLPSCPADSTKSCLGGQCQMEADATGHAVKVCDARGGMGAACYSPGECVSGACVGGKCGVAGSGQPNGSACSVPSDCTSGMCTMSVCKGAGLVGDACKADVDCSVGKCCTSGPNAGKCAQGC